VTNERASETIAFIGAEASRKGIQGRARRLGRPARRPGMGAHVFFGPALYYALPRPKSRLEALC
jgi:hypothetical protein